MKCVRRPLGLKEEEKWNEPAEDDICVQRLRPPRGFFRPIVTSSSHLSPCYLTSKQAWPPSPPPLPSNHMSCKQHWCTANILSITLTQQQCVKKARGRKGSGGKGIKKAGGGREEKRRHICSTHLGVKRYNYLSQHIIHVLYQPRAPCRCLATLTTCKGHILTLAMTVYLRKENCPLG